MPPSSKIQTKTNRATRPISDDQAEADLKPNTTHTYTTLYERQLRKTTLALMDGEEDVVHVTPDDIVSNWAKDMHKSRFATACLSRAALLWYFETYRPAGWETAHIKLKTLMPRKVDFEQEASSDEVSFRRTRPPGRMIPEKDLHTLINELLNFRKTGAQAQLFLLAGIASGARPIEWIKAKWIDEPNGVLRIYTAKIKTRNAWDNIPAMTFTAEDLDGEMDEVISDTKSINGEKSWHAIDFSRRLSGIQLTREELDELNSARYFNGVSLFRDVQIEEKSRTHVTLHMRSVKDAIASKQASQGGLPADQQLTEEQIFNKFYFGRIRHCLWRACTAAFKGAEMYSLADTRSTFSANRKGIVGLEQAASDMGHVGRFSARDYYAPASKAWTQYKNVHGNTRKPGQSDGHTQSAVSEAASPAVASSSSEPSIK